MLIEPLQEFANWSISCLSQFLPMWISVCPTVFSLQVYVSQFVNETPANLTVAPVAASSTA